jgi:hypothetical protein
MEKHGSPGSRPIEILLDETYLFILTRRPKAAALARELGIPEGKLDGILRRLSASLKKNNLHVASVRRGKGRGFELRSSKDPKQPVDVGSITLGMRRPPSRRPELKPEDEVIYARDW